MGKFIVVTNPYQYILNNVNEIFIHPPCDLNCMTMAALYFFSITISNIKLMENVIVISNIKCMQYHDQLRPLVLVPVPQLLPSSPTRKWVEPTQAQEVATL